MGIALRGAGGRQSTPRARFRSTVRARYTRCSVAQTQAKHAVNRRSALGAALAAALSALASSGCGQKGPLFLPEEKFEEKRDELERKRDGAQPQRSSTRPAASARHLA